jgi:glycosyltransferase involved in cell wall biosynthesis
MRISLIISVYNRLELLQKCLQSLNRQTRLPDEIILTDDGSDEDILGLLEEWKPRFTMPFRLVRQAHEQFRLARLRNNGVFASTGDLLLFIDQDIVPAPGYIERFATLTCPRRFLVGYPVRLTSEQSERLDEGVLRDGDILSVTTPEQRAKVLRQYRKDRLNNILFALGLSAHGTKLRGGVCGILREDYLRVNGYDEHFVGWGNEDDDMGRRLLAAGVKGLNVIRTECPLHLFHPPNHDNGRRVNRDYASSSQQRIREQGYRCQQGLASERSDIVIL